MNIFWNVLGTLPGGKNTGMKVFFAAGDEEGLQRLREDRSMRPWLPDSVRMLSVPDKTITTQFNGSI